MRRCLLLWISPPCRCRLEHHNMCSLVLIRDGIRAKSQSLHSRKLIRNPWTDYILTSYVFALCFFRKSANPDSRSSDAKLLSTGSLTGGAPHELGMLGGGRSPSLRNAGGWGSGVREGAALPPPRIQGGLGAWGGQDFSTGTVQEGLI